jgi:O-antigen/teichoic acid export membrane protein
LTDDSRLRLLDRLLDTRIGKQITGTSHRARLIRGTSGTFVVRMSNTGLKFLSTFVLARLLGTNGFGVYNFALAWVMLLIVPAISGFDRLLIRNMAMYRAHSAWGHMHGLLRFVNRVTIGFALVLMLAGIGIAWLTYQMTGRPALLNAEQAGLARVALYALALGLLLLPLRAILLLQQAAMQGLRHVVVGQLPEQILQPALFVVIIGSLYVLGRAVDNVRWVMALQVLTTVVAVGYSFYLLQRLVPRAVQGAVPAFEARLWVYSALPFALGRGFATIDAQIDALMLGTLVSAKSVALFAITQRGTMLITLVLTSVNTALAPTFAQLYAEKNQKGLQRAATQGARAILAGALPLTVFFIVWGDKFLALFGHEYVAAHTALIVLSLGQLINAATGSVGLLLLMTDYQRENMLVNGLSLGVHLALNFLLVPRWGIEGAAVAGAVAIGVNNLVEMWIVWHYMRLHTTALGVIRLWGRRA